MISYVFEKEKILTFVNGVGCIVEVTTSVQSYRNGHSGADDRQGKTGTKSREGRELMNKQRSKGLLYRSLLGRDIKLRWGRGAGCTKAELAVLVESLNDIIFF